MATRSPFATARAYQPAELAIFREVEMAGRFGVARDDFAAARETAAVFDRSDRGLLIARGPDRKVWLHNLVTNAVKTLDDNAGNYAFATDVRGRTQFDMNILVLPDELWLDIDGPNVPKAKAHLERYLITEKVELADAGGQFARLGVSGPDAGQAATRLGVGNFTAMAALQSAALSAGSVRLVRHDFIGLPGFELIVPRVEAPAWWDRLAGELGVRPAGAQAREALRIEAGIPAFPFDIDDKVIPPETGQIERGISYNKGCYLGQEVMERLRSMGAPAKRLVRLTAAEAPSQVLPAPIMQRGMEVGRLTSFAAHPLSRQGIGLGYLRATLKDYSDLVAGDLTLSVCP